MVDLILASIPYTEHKHPLAAIGLLKGIAIDAGWSCKTLDYNVHVLNHVKASKHKDKLVDWFFSEFYHPEIEQEIDHMFENMAKEILSYDPKLIGISVFTYACQTSTKYLCIKLREMAPHKKIIIGGSGIFDSVLGDHDFVDSMQAMNLIDHYITGDAEVSFREFLQGNAQAYGVDRPVWHELDNDTLATLPFPDYNDYSWDSYESKAIPIVGSRGCVRRCTFCNDIVHWKKFSYRTGQHIYEEMVVQSQKYGINLFYFTDALINGSLKEFKSLIKLLAEHNNRYPGNKLSWDSQFIFRPKNQFTADDWALLAESNPARIHVGIESLSERVRFDVGKKFNQEDVEFNLTQALKHDIKVTGMMIVGYPTEDKSDIDYIKDWLTRNQHYNKVFSISWGGTMSILPGTYLDDNREKYGLQVYGPPYQNWISSITGSNPKQRVEWLMELRTHAMSLGFNNPLAIENQMILSKLLTYEYEEEWTRRTNPSMLGDYEAL